MAILLVQQVDFTTAFPGRTQLGYALSDPGNDSPIQVRQLVDVHERLVDGDPTGIYIAETSIPEAVLLFTITWDDPGTGETVSETYDWRVRREFSAAGVVPGVAKGLAGAIVDRVQAIPQLIDLLPGGFYFGTPDEESDDNPPYGILTWIAGTPIYDSEGLAGYRDRYQVSLVGPRFEALQQFWELWAIVYFTPRMASLPIVNRVFSSLYNHEASSDIGDDIGSVNAENMAVLRWEFEVLTGTVRP